MDPQYKLPTTKELAEKGVAEFALLLKQFSANTRQIFIGAAATKPRYTKFFDVRRCVAGISAEIAFETYILDAFPKKSFEEAEHVINSQAQHFFFYRREKVPHYYHLFNLLAVRQVAMNYPEYFPGDVGTNTRTWLQHNWQMWADGRGMNCIRYGLLSGFPLEAARKFSLDKEAKEKHVVRSEKTHLSYFGANPEKDTEYIQQLDEIFISLLW